MKLKDVLLALAGLSTFIGLAMLLLGAFWIGWETFNSVKIVDRDDRPLGMLMMGAALMAAGLVSFQIFCDGKPADTKPEKKAD